MSNLLSNSTLQYNYILYSLRFRFGWIQIVNFLKKRTEESYSMDFMREKETSKTTFDYLAMQTFIFLC